MKNVRPARTTGPRIPAAAARDREGLERRASLEHGRAEDPRRRLAAHEDEGTKPRRGIPRRSCRTFRPTVFAVRPVRSVSSFDVAARMRPSGHPLLLLPNARSACG